MVLFRNVKMRIFNDDETQEKRSKIGSEVKKCIKNENIFETGIIFCSNIVN